MIVLDLAGSEPASHRVASYPDLFYAIVVEVSIFLTLYKTGFQTWTFSIYCLCAAILLVCIIWALLKPSTSHHNTLGKIAFGLFLVDSFFSLARFI